MHKNTFDFGILQFANWRVEFSASTNFVASTFYFFFNEFGHAFIWKICYCSWKENKIKMHNILMSLDLEIIIKKTAERIVFYWTKYLKIVFQEIQNFVWYTKNTIGGKGPNRLQRVKTRSEHSWRDQLTVFQVWYFISIGAHRFQMSEREEWKLYFLSAINCCFACVHRLDLEARPIEQWSLISRHLHFICQCEHYSWTLKKKSHVNKTLNSKPNQPR